MPRKARAERAGVGVVRPGSRYPRKMRNVPTTYNGERYDSKKEAAYAATLDLQKRNGLIRDWRRGTTMYLVVNGVELKGPSGRRLSYKPDFIVEPHKGEPFPVDVKGRKSGVQYTLFWLKKQILAANGILVMEV